jgi:peroxiredoxin
MKSILAMLVLSGVAMAGEFNKTLSIGDTAPTWKDLEGTDGKKHGLDEFKDKDVVVIVFTCNSCPIAESYEDRLVAFAKIHAQKVAIVAINPNTIKDDLLPKMKERATKKKFSFPYLHDPTQATAKAYGAMYTPEFFVLNKDRKIAYMGSMDDKTKADAVKNKYLEDAVTATLAGKPAAKAESSASRGCRIRYVQKKEE